jgi:hypothetical protein
LLTRYANVGFEVLTAMVISADILEVGGNMLL